MGVKLIGYRVTALGMYVIVVWLIGPGVLPALLPTAKATEPQQKKLPPLIVDTNSPLLLEGAGKKVAGDKKMTASVAENTACYVCHANYSDEPLVQWHAQGGVGCVDCHGKSFAHRNDENNTTPPDRMFPLDEIDASCTGCHDSHDVPAAEVVARMQQRVPRIRSGEVLVCTQCHGQHRLKNRSVLWERATGRLLTGSKDLAQKAKIPHLGRLKELTGVWVEVGENGEPTEKVVSILRATAAGSAVVETLFPGGKHEMVTVYYQDGDDLLLTHFCAAQNQPRMKCVAGDRPQVLIFEFVDATNMESPEERHMHAGKITILGPDRIRSEWQLYDRGNPKNL